MTRKRTYTEEEFIEAVKNSLSIRRVLITLGLTPFGGNYLLVKRRIKSLNLNASHFTGQGHLKDKTHNWTTRIPLSNILINNSTYLWTSCLRKRLIREGILNKICSSCAIKEWLGHPMPLELDHINGKRTDNRLENLRLLCPNCHALTPTHAGKNIGKATE